MFKTKIQKAVLFIVLSVIVISAAYVLGTEAREYLSKKEKLSNRIKRTDQILEWNQSLEIGKQLPNTTFETLDFSPITFDELLTSDTMLVIIIEPGCEACHEDMLTLTELFNNGLNQDKVIFLSAGNPRYLIDFKKEYKLKSNIAYDHERFFISSLNITTFPFHLLVNKDREILNIIPGQLMRDDLNQLL